MDDANNEKEKKPIMFANIVRAETCFEKNIGRNIIPFLIHCLILIKFMIVIICCFMTKNHPPEFL